MRSHIICLALLTVIFVATYSVNMVVAEMYFEEVGDIMQFVLLKYCVGALVVDTFVDMINRDIIFRTRTGEPSVSTYIGTTQMLILFVHVAFHIEFQEFPSLLRFFDEPSVYKYIGSGSACSSDSFKGVHH